ncbi:MAG: hypothetical protein IKJ11_09320 [Clostridia bacterium]|nr:hypothetical protein [Clostridia bacterium]
MADVVITFVDEEKNNSHDIVMPDWITADEFIGAMCQAYALSPRETQAQRFMRMERPIGLIRGSFTLAQLGVRDGAVIYSGKGG